MPSIVPLSFFPMAFAYTSAEVYLSTWECQSSNIMMPLSAFKTAGMAFRTFQTQPPPPTPYLPNISLPNCATTSSPNRHLSSGNHTRPGLFPIQLMESLESLSHMTDLLSFDIYSTIHIHTPTLHIGILHPSPNPNPNPSQLTDLNFNKFTALDVELYLQTIAQDKLDLNTYLQLPLFLRDQVKQSFYNRVGSTPIISGAASSDAAWSDFISGINGTTLNLNNSEDSDVVFSGPLGCDLFLGNIEVCGLENSICGMYSIVHIT